MQNSTSFKIQNQSLCVIGNLLNTMEKNDIVVYMPEIAASLQKFFNTIFHENNNILKVYARVIKSLLTIVQLIEEKHFSKYMPMINNMIHFSTQLIGTNEEDMGDKKTECYILLCRLCNRIAMKPHLPSILQATHKKQNV